MQVILPAFHSNLGGIYDELLFTMLFGGYSQFVINVRESYGF